MYFREKYGYFWGKTWHSNQVQSDRLPIVSGDVTSGTQKMLKKGICKRHLVKWQEVPSRKITYPNIFKWFKHTFFSGNIFFLTFGNAKNPTGLKPYWSRAGLRHPGFHWFCSTARGLFTRHSWYVSTIANANALFLGNKAPLIPIELLCFSSALMCLVGMKGKTKGQPGSARSACWVCKVLYFSSEY